MADPSDQEMARAYLSEGRAALDVARLLCGHRRRAATVAYAQIAAELGMKGMLLWHLGRGRTTFEHRVSLRVASAFPRAWKRLPRDHRDAVAALEATYPARLARRNTRYPFVAPDLAGTRGLRIALPHVEFSVAEARDAVRAVGALLAFVSRECPGIG